MAAEPAADADFAAFLIVRKNRDSCIHWLLTYCQAIEREWSDAELRRRRLASLRRCLASLAEHAHADCRELAPLAPRMLHSTDFDERCARRPPPSGRAARALPADGAPAGRHFLNLVLPIERRHSRGLRDDELHGADSPPAQGGARDVPGTFSRRSEFRPTGAISVSTGDGRASAARPPPLPLVVVCDRRRSASLHGPSSNLLRTVLA